MTFSNDKNGDARLKIDPSRNDQPIKAKARRAEAGEEDGVGRTLRTVYQRAVDEAIPPEMLDLLGKLN